MTHAHIRSLLLALAMVGSVFLGTVALAGTTAL
jgi:surface glycoprotein (TIGR04207 family)